jgi:hypothetical protein
MVDGTPTIGNWHAVRDAMHARLTELDISKAELARRTGLSETTIRYLGTGSQANRAAIVAISALLRWRYDHLTNILRGQPEKNVHLRPALSVNLERSLQAEFASLKDELQKMKETLYAINEKIPTALALRHQGHEETITPVSTLPVPGDIDADYSPQYVKLARILRDKIRAGVIRRSSTLRARDLAGQYGVSVEVALATLNMLCDNSYVERPQKFRHYKVTWNSGARPL